VFLLDGATYRFVGIYEIADPFKSPGFPDLELDLKAVFDFPVGSDDPVCGVKEEAQAYSS
jgi:hypothetical protein